MNTIRLIASLWPAIVQGDTALRPGMWGEGPTPPNGSLQITYLSKLLSCSTLKSSSQPTSIKTLIPPSNSRRDCEAGEVD